MAMGDGGGCFKSVAYHYQVSPNGCPSRVIKVNGEVVWSVNCAAFGLTYFLVSILENNIRFQG